MPEILTLIIWQWDKKTKTTAVYEQRIVLKICEIMKKNKIGETLHLLNIAYLINKEVKAKAYASESVVNCPRCGSTEEEYTSRGYYCLGSDFRDCYFESTTVDYNLRDKIYLSKEILIKKVLKNIKTFNLPIKYGKLNGIIYFEFKSSQVSFHDPKNKIKGLKIFRGSWKGVNAKAPFFR